ncbi:MAG TPA: ABC transporter ATP-binding protein [Candidatus Wirthbacteria bacterium]|nr:ABC transporter ATP-binding protein [Candidatus Wirthbacteria bacterium]
MSNANNQLDYSLSVTDMTKYYQLGGETIKALDGVTMQVEKGEMVAVMGPSGSGKTTLLNMIGALDRPTSGEIEIQGKKISRLKDDKLYYIRRHKIGFIFQRFHLVPTLSAYENVLIPLMPMGKIFDSTKQRATELLQLLGLDKRMHHKPKELSGGERQRVAIARSLILEPAIILADEPTGNLDSKTGQAIMEVMKELNAKEKRTFVIVTHDPDIAKQTHRTLEIHDGKITT